MLLSRNELPRRGARASEQLDEVSQKTLTRRIEGFTGGQVSRFGWTVEDQQLLLIFLVLFVVVMQIKMMMQMDLQQRHSFQYHPHANHFHRQQNDRFADAPPQ
jgi:hypothetical protein